MPAKATESKESKAMTTDALDNIFGCKPEGAIFMPSQPYALKLNCKSGQVFSMADEYVGDEMEISIVKVARYFGTLGMTENEEWLNLLFVPAPGCDVLPKDTVCSTVIKKRSLSTFHNVVSKLLGDGMNPATGIFKVSFKPHSGKLGQYFSVHFKWRERQGDDEAAQLERIANFMQSQRDLLDTRLEAQLVPIDGMSADEVQTLMAAAQNKALAPAE